MEPDRPPLALLLRRARRHADLTQPELADRLGISKRSVAGYETGETAPPATIVARWLHVCGRPMDDLLVLVLVEDE